MNCHPMGRSTQSGQRKQDDLLEFTQILSATHHQS